MIAETCGIPAMPANVAPPLKSTRTKFRISGEWVMASPRTRVRSSSDLPEPVAPMTSPCGPMPCCADSLMSRLIETPSAPTPIGTRSRSRGGRGRQVRPRSSWWTSPIPSRSVSSVLLVRASSRTGPSPAYRGVRRRAAASAVAMLIWSAKPRIGSCRGTTAATRTRPASSPSRCSRTRLSSLSSSQRSGMSMTVIPSTPSSVMTEWPTGTVTLSRTTTTCGDTAVRDGPNRARSLRSAGSSETSSSRSVHTRRRGPAASASRRLCAWGSHLTQSQCASDARSVRTATTSWSGAWKVAAWTSRARACALAWSSEPVISMRANEFSATAVGRSGRIRCVASRRCSAEADTGSSLSMVSDSGGLSSSPRRCGPRAYRTRSQSSSLGARSQTRVPSSATAARATGSGWIQVRCLRCSEPARRASSRMPRR